MMNKILVLIIPILLITSLACTLTGQANTRFGYEAGLVAPDLVQTEEPKDYETPTPKPELSPEESIHQGLHTYRIEGTTNTTSEGQITGNCQSSHWFDNNGVNYHYLGSAPEAYYKRISENYYELILDNGTKQSLRYFDKGYQWTSINSMGGGMDWTFWLDE